MQDPENVNLNQEVELFDPHPGFAGAAIRIPQPIKEIADELDGKVMPLKEAVERLRGAGIGEIKIVPDYQYIALTLGVVNLPGGEVPRHLFRVIRYRHR